MVDRLAFQLTPTVLIRYSPLLILAFSAAISGCGNGEAESQTRNLERGEVESQPSNFERLARAREFAEMGQASAAIIEYKNLIQAQPENAGLRYEMGNVLVDSGDGAAAEQSFERAIEFGMDNFETRFALARARFLLGKYEDVLHAPKVRDAPDASSRAALHVLRGNAQMRTGELEAARGSFRSALTALPQYSPAFASLAPISLSENDLNTAELMIEGAEQGAEVDQSEVKRLRGLLNFVRGDYATAEEAFQASTDLRPHSILARRDLAAAQIRQGKYAEAKENLEQVLAQEPGEARTLFLRSVVAYVQEDFRLANQLASKVAAELVSPGTLFIAGASAYQLAAYEQARDHLSRLLAVAPRHTGGRNLLALTLLHLGEAGAAYDALKPIADEAEGNAAMLGFIGTVASLAGHYRQGEVYLQEAVDLRPQDTDLRTRLATVRVAEGDREAGIAELEKLAKEEDPSVADPDLFLAKLHIRAGDFNKAVDALHGGDEDPASKSAEAWLVEGLAYLGSGDLDKAEEAFQQVSKESEHYADAQTGLAEVRTRKGDTSGAREILDELEGIYPNLVTSLINLAVLDEKSGKPEQAVARLKEGVILHPENLKLKFALIEKLLDRGLLSYALQSLDSWSEIEDPSLLQVRGRVELTADRPEAAIQTYERLVQLRPESIEALLSLAKAYERGEDYANASSTLDVAYSLDQRHLETRAARARLALLRPDWNEEDISEALKTVTDLTQSDPNDARVGELRGIGAWYLEEYEVARALLEAAHAALDSADSAALLARFFWKINKDDAALNILNDWILKHPYDNYARHKLATLQLQVGELQGAARNIQHALDSGSQRPEQKLALAWCMVRTGQVRDAARYAEAAFSQNRWNRRAQYVLGRVYLEQGRNLDALRLLRNAAEQFTQDARIQVDFAKALLAAGMLEDAREILDKLLAVKDGTPERLEAARLHAELP